MHVLCPLAITATAGAHDCHTKQTSIDSDHCCFAINDTIFKLEDHFNSGHFTLLYIRSNHFFNGTPFDLWIDQRVFAPIRGLEAFMNPFQRSKGSCTTSFARLLAFSNIGCNQPHIKREGLSFKEELTNNEQFSIPSPLGNGFMSNRSFF